MLSAAKKPILCLKSLHIILTKTNQFVNFGDYVFLEKNNPSKARNQNVEDLGDIRHTICEIDPSAAPRTPVRAGPNGVDRVLGDLRTPCNGDCLRKCPLFSMTVRIIHNEYSMSYVVCGMS